MAGHVRVISATARLVELVDPEAPPKHLRSKLVASPFVFNGRRDEHDVGISGVTRPDGKTIRFVVPDTPMGTRLIAEASAGKVTARRRLSGHYDIDLAPPRRPRL